MDLRVSVRALMVWVLIACAETLHGIARTLVLQPIVGDLTARQLAVASGAAIVLAIALLAVRWIGAATRRQWFGIGLLWLLLTVGFDLALGRWILGFSWERLAEDFAIWEGRLFPLGLLVLALAPWIAARLRRLPSAR
jgi:hypothetical protein